MLDTRNKRAFKIKRKKKDHSAQVDKTQLRLGKETWIAQKGQRMESVLLIKCAWVVPQGPAEFLCMWGA